MWFLCLTWGIFIMTWSRATVIWSWNNWSCLIITPSRPKWSDAAYGSTPPLWYYHHNQNNHPDNADPTTDSDIIPNNFHEYWHHPRRHMVGGCLEHRVNRPVSRLFGLISNYTNLFGSSKSSKKITCIFFNRYCQSTNSIVMLNHKRLAFYSIQKWNNIYRTTCSNSVCVSS